jgi:hypothetical protein
VHLYPWHMEGVEAYSEHILIDELTAQPNVSILFPRDDYCS